MMIATLRLAYCRGRVGSRWDRWNGGWGSCELDSKLMVSLFGK
jgi:hypothetical protein